MNGGGAETQRPEIAPAGVHALFYGPADWSRRSDIRRFLPGWRDLGFWVWPRMTAALLILMGCAGLFGPELLPYTVVIGVIILLSERRARRDADLRQASTIVDRIRCAVELRLPLPESLRAAAEEERGRTARALRGIAGLIEMGADVGRAISLAAPWVERRVAELLTIAQVDGTLRPTLAKLSADLERRNQGPTTRWAFYPMYLLVLVGVSAIVIAYPTRAITEIIKGIRAPRNSYQIIYGYGHPHMVPSVSNPAWVNDLYWVAIGCIALLFLVALGAMSSQGGRIARVMHWAWRRVSWWMPLAHGMERDRGLADVLRGAQRAVEAGRPIESSAALLATMHLSVGLSRRVMMWGMLMQAGRDPGEAARMARLPALLYGMVAPAMRAGALAPTLRFLANHYETRFSRTAIMLSSAVAMACIAIGAALVWSAAASDLLPVWRLTDVLVYGINNHP